MRFPPASAVERPVSESETTFKDETLKNDLDQDNKSGAPKNGAANTKSVVKTISTTNADFELQTGSRNGSREVKEAVAPLTGIIPMNEIIEYLRREIEPCMRTAAAQAAASAAACEASRTREWFEMKALPKAVRVAQSETYQILRKHGTLDARQERARAESQVGRASDDEAASVSQARPPLEQREIKEIAETCVALLETQGKAIDVTLSEISSEGGGWVLPEDAPKVRAEAEKLLRERGDRR